MSNSNPIILDVRTVRKTFVQSERELTILRDVSLTLTQGETAAILGPSGSGKTTLLGLCAGLDRPTTGTVRLLGTDLAALDEEERARLRREKIGFVFQSFRLLPTLTALENVMLPLELLGQTSARARALEALDRVGIAERGTHFPSQLSGGEQQRVGIARAFIHSPALLFADEPTGNLDTESAERVMALLFELNRSVGTTLVVVTHNEDLARRARRTLRITAGILTDEGPRA